MISRKSQIPLYIQLADTLREKIKNGEIKEGDKLESETEMIKHYHLGRLTIREALGVLVNEGLLEKRHGKGTFCKTNIVQKKYRVDIFLNLAETDFIPYYLRSICGVLEAENINIVMADTRNDAEVICSLLENAILDGTDGIIFQPTNSEEDAPEKLCEILDRLEENRVPYIMIDTYYRNVAESYVVMDEFQAGKIAADYLIRLGHTRLCAIEQSDRVDSRGRTEGFVSALDEKPCIIEYDENLHTSITEALAKTGDITGIFCFNDGIAKKCYDILSTMNISIPEDISLISVDDTVIASALSPTLTSIIHPKEHLGKEAAKAILSMISGKSMWPYKKVFQPAIAIRESCREM